MYILVTGVRHRTAPIEVREKFALLEEEVQKAIPVLLTCAGIHECAILTTCNRTEIYVAVEDTEVGVQSIRQFYKLFKQFDMDAYRPYTFTLMHEDAVMHLFRVASGLDSLIVGEGQILGQVKEALSTAQKLKSTGTVLDRLFKTALTVGKRVRTETGIAEKDVSVSLAAYEYAKNTDPELLNRKIALIGGGKMAEILMVCLRRDMTPVQLKNVTIVNRSNQRLQALMDKHHLKGAGWEKLDEVIAGADVLFVATGAPHVVLGQMHFENKGPKLVMDISVPRNVDPRVDALPNVQLFNTDNLAGTSGFSQETQAQLKAQAQEILEEECQKFQQWRISLSVVPTISMLRAKVETIRQAEVAAMGPELASTYSLIDTLSKNLVQKILHDPTVRLKTSGSLKDIYQQASVLSHLFDIDPVEAPTASSFKLQAEEPAGETLSL